MISRREAREQAFRLVFEMTFQNLPVEDLLEGAKESADFEADEYAVKVVRSVQMNMAQIDEIISALSRKWKIDRLSKTTLAILRLAIAEIKFVCEVPTGAVINEAVELAKTYGGEDDASYVNGVLGGMVRQDENPTNE